MDWKIYSCAVKKLSKKIAYRKSKRYSGATLVAGRGGDGLKET